MLSIIGCVPKYDYVKTEFEHDVPPVENILFVLDYITLKDDVGELWDFDENYNLKHMDKYYSQIKSLLEAKGYNVLGACPRIGIVMKESWV